MGVFCPFCGSGVDPAQAQPGELPGTVRCPTCRQEIDLPGAAPPPGPAPLVPHLPGFPGQEPETPSGSYAAWEGEGGFFSRLLRTIGLVLFHPVRFFSAPARPGYAWALSFALILGTLGQACNVLWGHGLGQQYVTLRSAVLGLVFAPLMVLISVFFTTWVLHFSLWILRGAHNGVRATFRVMAYGQATSLLLALPYLGIFLAAVWGMVVAIGGLAAAHGTGRWRVFWALVLPLALLLGLIATITLVMFAVGLGSFFLERMQDFRGTI
ncbi:YIP1 family protein [Desulfoferula mesophila]|uniref:Yip1 domain-containing protein n=1 Tax=Desulfoferula mesophila TaxID=3058419 RepID=A0AAU9EWA2_9BACT|nr:hypothetical protein FAK_29010 [Desulfoferula mesophilus]